MNEHAVISADLERSLSDSFKERCGFDIAHRTAYLGNDNVCCAVLADAVKPFLDLVCDVRNDLHRAAEIISASFLVEHRPVDFTRCDI